MILYDWFIDAELAGVKTNDHLIEINGENIENIGDEQVIQRIFAIKYPQPLQILVADSATYNYYKQQNKLIHNRLPTVEILPGNIIDQLPSPTPSLHRGIFIIYIYFLNTFLNFRN
jgi:hypothetical protein